MTKDEALKLVQEALAALENISNALCEDDVLGSDIELMLNTITAIHKALALPEQDKYQWLVDNSAKWSWNPSNAYKGKISGFAHKGTGYLGYALDEAVCLAMSDTTPSLSVQPVQRQWVGLTDDDLLQIRETVQIVEGRSLLQSLTKAIEAKLKEKNNGT